MCNVESPAGPGLSARRRTRAASAASSVAASLAVWAAGAHAQAQTPPVLADLDAQGRTTLTSAEASQLLAGAKMRRVNLDGSSQAWTNDASGAFVISSDNRGTQSSNSTARGTWKVGDDGRYCVTIEWKRNPTEDWCRYIVKSGDRYFATRDDKLGTGRVYRLEIEPAGAK